MKCGIAGLVTTLDIKISGWSNLRARSRKRIAKKVTKLRKWLLPFEHYRREEDSPMATLSAVAMSYHTEQLFGSPRYHTSKPTFREEMCEILIEQCFLPSHGLRCTKISNLSKFVGVLRKQNYAESNHIDLASFPVPQPAACNYVSKYMYLEGLFTLLCMDRMHRNCRVQKEPSKGFPNRLIRAKVRKFKQSVMIQGQSTKIVTLPSAPDMYSVLRAVLDQKWKKPIACFQERQNLSKQQRSRSLDPAWPNGQTWEDKLPSSLTKRRQSTKRGPSRDEHTYHHLVDTQRAALKIDQKIANCRINQASIIAACLQKMWTLRHNGTHSTNNKFAEILKALIYKIDAAHSILCTHFKKSERNHPRHATLSRYLPVKKATMEWCNLNTSEHPLVANRHHRKV